MIQTCVYDSYWRFAAERHAMYLRRLSGGAAPWTDNPILQAFRFTNVFRAADRVSQFLIRDVQYRADRSQAPAEVFFRTMLFKLFNKISTWERLEQALGPLSWQSTDLSAICAILDKEMSDGRRIYSAAYIIPAPQLGRLKKHQNHLALLRLMMDEGLSAKVQKSKSLAEVFDLLSLFPGIGKFLAFQYTIDLNYSSLLEFSESEFVVAGPGALDGISKCFHDTGESTPEEVIYRMVDAQQQEFRRLGLTFGGLFGRQLQPIDCQNLFCEISKYARVAHPHVRGVANRTRIKQSYRVISEALDTPVFPPRWKLNTPAARTPLRPNEQLKLWA